MQLTKTLSRSSQPRVLDEPRPPWFRVLPEDGVLTLILLVIVVYTTIGSVQSVTPAWAPGLGILTATTGAGLLLGYVTVQQGRLPSALVQIVAMALGVAFAFVQTADAVVGGDRGMLWDRTREWFHRAILLRQSSDDNAVFLLFLAILSFLLAFISVWLVIHTRRPWLAALANGVVLLINLNYSTEDKTLFFLVIYLLATLLLLVRFTLAENMRQWRARGLRFSPDLSWDFMQAGAIFAVAVLLLAYLLPAWAPNSALTDWWNSPNNPWQAVQQRFEALFNGVQGNGPGALNFFGGDLQLRGTVSLPNVTVLRYTVPLNAGNDPTQYLITRTLDVYNGQNSWSSSQTQVQSYTAGETQPPTSEVVTPNVYTITLVNQPAGSPVFAPGSEAESFSIPTQAFQDVLTHQGVGWVASDSIGPGDHYQAVGYISAATVDQLRKVPYPADMPAEQQASLFPQAVLQEDLPVGQIAPDALQNITALAHSWAEGTTNMYDAATAIENHLRSSFTYTLSIPDVPSGVDAITWFLQQKQGFCTFFATTMAIMGRALGMPTRIALGFASGKFDTATNSFVVKGTEAHAWPQIYFGKYGWVNFEPTADQFGKFSRPVGSGSSIGSVPTGGPGGPGGTPAPTRGPHDVTGPGGSSSTPGGGQANPVLVDAGLGASLLIVLVLLFAVVFSIWWRLIFRGLSPITAAFARIARLGSWAGAPPERSQTSDEYAERLAHVIPGQRSTLLRLSALYSRERYGGGATEETPGETPQLYEQVRRSVSPVILRRLRKAPRAVLTRGRGLLRRRRRDDS